LIVAATLGIASAILDAAALSFLGLGAQPPMAEWGTMLGSERNQVFTAPHLVFFPGIAIMITVWLSTCSETGCGMPLIHVWRKAVIKSYQRKFS
jgi:ABC-type dipeptide/oligopeptide/nickel transport system permease subunit